MYIYTDGVSEQMVVENPMTSRKMWAFLGTGKCQRWQPWYVPAVQPGRCPRRSLYPRILPASRLVMGLQLVMLCRLKMQTKAIYVNTASLSQDQIQHSECLYIDKVTGGPTMYWWACQSTGRPAMYW